MALLNDKTVRAFGLFVPIITILALLKFTDMLNLAIEENIGNTGVKFSAVLIVFLIIQIYLIYKRRI